MIRWRQALVALGLMLSLVACAGRQHAHPLEPPYLMHVVLVWLKQPGHPEHRQQIVEASHKLSAIPGVRELRVGEVVISDRAVVEDSYDVALSLRFDDAEALASYLNHPLHIATVKTDMAPLMQRYQVFDFQAR